GAVPNVEPGPVVTGAFISPARRGAEVRWSLMRPPSVAGPLPLVVALHGHGGSTGQLIGPSWDLPRFLAAAVRDGVPPFALATVNGGNSFWHPRPTGEDSGAMVTDEFLPMLAARSDVAPGRIGLLGWSMGGYGALRLAGQLGPDRVAAVVAGSPGLYTDPELAHPDGFVGAAEYEQFSIMESQTDLAGIPVRIDVGASDPFCPAVRVYVAGFADDADVTSTFEPGWHALGYSLRMLPDELAFLGARVASDA
ncbi:MAG: alpha/beta hydrolase-fold protein, partial [Nocardioides sp.]